LPRRRRQLAVSGDERFKRFDSAVLCVNVQVDQTALASRYGPICVREFLPPASYLRNVATGLFEIVGDARMLPRLIAFWIATKTLPVPRAPAWKYFPPIPAGDAHRFLFGGVALWGVPICRDRAPGVQLAVALAHAAFPPKITTMLG